MEIVHKLTMYLDQRRLVPCVDAVQCDANTRVLELTLLSGGEAWVVPSGMGVAVAFRKSDGTAGLYDVLPDGTKACSYSGNVVRAVLAPQVLTAWGRAEVAVVIQDPSTLDRVATFPVHVEVARDPSTGKGISNDYYNYKTMAEVNDAIDELWAAVGSGGSGGSCGCSITVARKGSEDDPVSLSGYGIGAGDVVRFPEGDYYVEPFDLVGLDHVTFLLGDARIHCVGSYFLFARGCDSLRVEGGTIVGGAETTHGIQIQRCKRAVFQQVCFSGIGTQSLADTKGLFILGECTGFLVDRCVFENISAGALTSDGYIHAYGILVNRDSSNAYSIRGDIRGCKFDGIAGIDGEVKADGDGIFIQRPPYLDDSGKVAGIDQVIDIDGCVFENCKKRGVKSAAWGTTVRDCVFEGEFYYAAVDLQYGHGTVDGCRIVNPSNYTGSVTSGVVANDGGFTVRDTYINCLYVNEDGTNGRHPGVRMDKRLSGSIFDKTVPWDPILVERCHFDEISYGVYAGTSVSGADTYRLTALEVLDCRWGAFYHGYGVDIEASVFDRIDVVRFVDFRFDAGDTAAEVRAVNSNFNLPIMVGAEPAKAYEIHSRYWLDKVVTSSNKPTAAHTRIVSVGEGCRKEYTAYGSRIWGSGDPNGKVSGDPEYMLLLGSKVGDEYTDTATGKKYACTATGGVGVWTEVGGVTAGADGGYYTPTVTQTEAGTMTVGYTASKSEMPSVAAQTVKLPAGPQGDTPVKGVDYWTDAERQAVRDEANAIIAEELAKHGQLKPEFADSIEKCTDTTKLYVLPDGYIYAYICSETVSGGYTNLAEPLSDNTTDTAKWVNGYRFSSSGISAQSGTTVSNPIPCKVGDVIRIKGATLRESIDRIALYFTKESGEDTIAVGYFNAGVTNDIASITYDGLENGVYAFTVTQCTGTITGFRFAMPTPTDASQVIVTVGEEITDPVTVKQYAWTNTGHAFVPNDYDEEFVAIGADIDRLKLDVAELESANQALTEDVEALGSKIGNIGGSDIPDHWKEMVAAKTETVKALQQAGGKNSVCFVWASDTHIPDSETDTSTSIGRTADLGKVMAAMLDTCEVPFALVTGDINTRGSYGTEDGFLGALAKVPSHLAPLWGTDRLLMALGNHDGCYGDSSGYYRMQFPPERLWQVFFRGQALDFRRVFSEDGLYYYVDDIPQKTRFIVLNSQFGGAYAADDNGWAVNDRFHTSCYGQAQLDWLADVALDMPQGYGAVITAHVPPNISDTVDKEQLIGIINAYCNRTTFSGSYTAGVEGWSNSEISVDFTDAKGEIIAMFAGHIHWDTVDTTTLACPLITIIAAGATVNEAYMGDGETAPARTFGTDTETSFDVVTINRATRTICCTRVGAGEDREISY